MRLRQLKEEEVLFTCEADDADTEAGFAFVVVTATWRTFQARAKSTRCSYPSEYGFPQSNEYRKLKIEALAALQASLLTAFFFLQELEVPDGACCENERRNSNGGCGNCGDPCL